MNIKDHAFLVSGGRTGTTYFGEILSEILEDTFSIHEPDLFEGFNKKTFQRIQAFGIWHMVVGRLLGKTGIRNLSQQYLSGRLSELEVDKKIHEHRDEFYDSIACNYLIESYSQWFGLLPAIRRVYPKSKIVGIIRDPRDWVQSWMNFGAHHDRLDLVRLFGHRRLDPSMVGDEKYIPRWNQMNQFERLCWDWKTINRIIFDFASRDANSKIFLFEELFSPNSLNGAQKELLDFLAAFENRNYPYRVDIEKLAHKKNASAPKIQAHWREWSPTQARQLEESCGGLMYQLGYGKETEWQELVNSRE